MFLTYACLGLFLYLLHWFMSLSILTSRWVLSSDDSCASVSMICLISSIIGGSSSFYFKTRRFRFFRLLLSISPRPRMPNR